MAKYEFQAEIAEAGVINILPSYAPFCESYLYLQESTEADWNELARSIGIQELGVLEATGSEIVYEANEGEEGTEAKQSVITKLVDFIKKQWEKVKGAFDDLLKKIQAKMAQAKEKFKGNTISKIKKKLNEGNVTRLYKDGSAKELGKFYDYKELDKVAGMSAKQLKAEENGTDVDTSVDDIKKKLRGNEATVDINWIRSNIDSIVNYAFDFKFTKKSVVVAYNDVKKGFDEEIKMVKVGPIDVKTKTERAKAGVKTLNKIASACVQLHIERQAKALGILTKVAVLTLGKSAEQKEAEKTEREQNKAERAAAKEAKGKEKVEESAIIAESYSTEVEKLFNWNF